MRHSIQNSFLAAVCIALSFSACAKVNQSTSTTKNTNTVQHGSGLALGVVSPDSIQGKWKNTCTKDLKTLSYYTTELSIQNAVVTASTVSYADTNCAFPIEENERVSNVDVQAESDVTLFTETLVSMKIKPLISNLVNAYNQSSYCHNSDWAVNTEVTITDATLCTDLNATQAFHAEIYGNQELYLSDCATTGQTDCSSVRYVKASN